MRSFLRTIFNVQCLLNHRDLFDRLARTKESWSPVVATGRSTRNAGGADPLSVYTFCKKESTTGDLMRNILVIGSVGPRKSERTVEPFGVLGIQGEPKGIELSQSCYAKRCQYEIGSACQAICSQSYSDMPPSPKTIPTTPKKKYASYHIASFSRYFQAQHTTRTFGASFSTTLFKSCTTNRRWVFSSSIVRDTAPTLPPTSTTIEPSFKDRQSYPSPHVIVNMPIEYV